MEVLVVLLMLQTYTSDGSFSGPSDVTSSISNGAGFVIFAGHGSPSTWGNHPPEDDNFTTGLQLRHMRKLRNNEKLKEFVQKEKPILMNIFGIKHGFLSVGAGGL